LKEFAVMAAKIVRVDMKNLKCTTEEAPPAYRLLGGRALTDRIVADEVPPGCHPLGAENKLVFGVGLLTGTTAPCSGRLSCGAKSPLTGGIKESNAGGPAGLMLARLGIKALILESQPAAGRSCVLRLTPAGPELTETPAAVRGKGTYDTVRFLREQWPGSSVMAIGQAGEACCAAACISVSNMEGIPSRNFGRGGLGAVLGSKGLKAVVINNEDARLEEPVARPEEFKAAVRELTGILREAGQALHLYGTAMLVRPINAAAALPTRNWRSGRFEQFEKISGQAIHERSERTGGRTGHGCQPGCPIRCSNIIHDEAGQYLTSSLEYETISLFGSNCLIDDLETIARLDRMCDDFGVDTIDTAGALAAAMDAGLLGFGDGPAALALVREIGAASPLGRLLASGVAAFCKVYGIRRVAAAKGQGLPAYDPRGCKGTGCTYATSAMGADHTAGNVLPGRGRDIDPHKPEHQAGVVRMLQVLSASMIDSTGCCLFLGPSLKRLPYITRLLNARYDLDWSDEELIRFGGEILSRERDFNRAAGLPDIDLPDWFRSEKLPPLDLVFDVPEGELARILDYRVDLERERAW
jgi:aldehyde:ferredoxin oxidoreductase